MNQTQTTSPTEGGVDQGLRPPVSRHILSALLLAGSFILAGSSLGAAADPVAYINAQNTGTVKQISAGGDEPSHTCAVTDVGAAYCWGKNEDGQLGNGRTGGISNVPVQVKAGDQGSGDMGSVGWLGYRRLRLA